MSAKQIDVCVIGGGVIGMCVALSMAQLGLSVELVETKAAEEFEAESGRPPYDERVFALNHHAQTYLTQLGVWPELLKQRIASYESMVLWAKGRDDSFTLTERDHPYPNLGYIVEHCVLLSTLWQAIKAQPTIIVRHQVKIKHLDTTGQITYETGEQRTAHLVVGADGARSWVRTQMQVPVQQRDYQQIAMVMNVAHALPHADTAFQCFDRDAPLAFLPLANPYHSSIVWSGSQAKMTALMALSDEARMGALSETFESKLGACQPLGAARSFPLQQLHTGRYFHDNTVLVGDAAHVVHPMAGWGMNLGLLDAAHLATVIKKALEKNWVIANPRTLREYERRRRSHNAWMLRLINGLKWAFQHEVPFSWMQNVSWIKQAMIHTAQGESRIPQLLK